MSYKPLALAMGSLTAPLQAVDTTITLASPAPFQIFQRAGERGAVTISGHGDGATEYAVSATWGGLSSGVLWQDTNSDFSIVWSGLPIGQNDLVVTVSDVSLTIPHVGIGDVYVIAGQSNAVGHGLNNQMYMDAIGLRAGMFTFTGWMELQDPVGITADFRADGSQWPLLATYILATGTPVAFVPTAYVGSSVANWQPGQHLFNRATFLLDKLPAPYARAVLWQQGERDILMRAKDYSRSLSIMANRFYTDYGLPVFAARLYDNSVVNEGIDIAIRGGAAVYSGADLRELPPDQGVHYKADAYLSSEAWYWWEALVEAGYYSLDIQK